MLPPYFESYKPFLEKIATTYFLRSHPMPLPPTSHVYAESGIIYQLVHMKKYHFHKQQINYAENHRKKSLTYRI